MDEEGVVVNHCGSPGEGGKTGWTKVMVARLIDLYKERKCLYDSQISSNREQRNACVQEIAVELGVSGLFMFYYTMLCISADYAVARCLSVSICLTHADIVPKSLNIFTNFFTIW